MSTSSSPVAPAADFSIESLLGTKLLVKVKTPAKPIKPLLEGKELIGLYFSASWCPPCKTFSPILTSFYNAAAKANNLEIVYISSDRTVEDFEGYYAKMPYLSIPFEPGSATVKKNLSEILNIQGIPSLIVIDAKTGEFVTGTAREDVTKAGGDPAKAKEVIEHWKSLERKPLAEGNVGDGSGNPIIQLIMFFVKNPLVLISILYLGRGMYKKVVAWYGYPHIAAMIEDEPLPEPDSEF